MLKPLRDLVHVVMLADVPVDGEPGVLAQVLAVGPDAKGIKAGDAVLVATYAATAPTPSSPGAEPAKDNKRRLLSAWEIVAKMTD